MARQYRSTEQTAIAWDLIRLTQSKLGGDLGITRGLGSYGGRGRDRTFVNLGRTIFDLIDDVGRATDGFEWWVDAERVWRVQSPVRWRNRSLDLTLDYGSTVSGVSRKTTTLYYTAVTLEGKDDETQPVTREVRPDERGRWETHLSENEVVLQSTLIERGDDLLAAAGVNLPYFKLTLVPEVLFANDLRIGDVCPLRLGQNDRLGDIGLVRIVEVDMSIDASGGERTVLGVESVSQTENLNAAVPARIAMMNRTDEVTLLSDLLVRLYDQAKRP